MWAVFRSVSDLGAPARGLVELVAALSMSREADAGGLFRSILIFTRQCVGGECYVVATWFHISRGCRVFWCRNGMSWGPGSMALSVCRQHEIAHWNFDWRIIPRASRTVSVQENAATNRCQRGSFSCWGVAFCMCVSVSTSRDFCAVSRRSFSWSSSLTSDVSAASTRGAHVSTVLESCLARIPMGRWG